LGVRRWILPLLILLIGSAFRFYALVQDARFHPDEALFATFARKAAVNGDWLLHGSLDKTPLSIYANAVSMMLIGVRPLPNGVLTLDVHMGEFAARVPGTFASILLIAVMYALAKRLYGKEFLRTRRALSLQHTPLIAMFLMAVSPYVLAFSATAFTDGLMLLNIALALWMATRGRWLWAGVWLALGYASKQQALFYVPLVTAVGWVQASWNWTTIARTNPKTDRLRKPLEGTYINFNLFRGLPNFFIAGCFERPAALKIMQFTLPLILFFALLAIWDAARAQDTSLWTLAVANNDPGRLIFPDEALPRLRIWGNYAANLIGSPWLTALLSGTGLLGLFWHLRTSSRTRSTRIDLILLLYILGYMLIHWLVALPTHDRYLLPILPPVILLVARGLAQIFKGVSQRLEDSKTQRLRNFFVPLCLCVLVLGFLPSALDALEGRLPVGGDRGERDGIDQLGAYLDSKPLGTIIYDHWLGWELGYYLGTWSNKRLTYYPNAGALSADAAAQPDPAPRYFPVPARAAIEPWLDQLAGAGFKIYEDYRSLRFIVYRLIPPSALTAQAK